MYVITGASGHTGKVAAEALLSQGQPVRVVLRNPAKAADWERRGAETAIAELDDVEALVRAFRGAKGVYLLLPPRLESNDSRRDNARRTEGLVKAIDRAGVPHVVFLSSIGAQLPEGTGPIATLHDAETALRGTKADVTFVRAAYFMENWASSLFALDAGVLPSFLRSGRPAPMVATRDIGQVAAKALLEGGHGESTIELAGPQDYTPEDVAAALSKVVGKPIALQVGPESAIEGALRGAGLNAHWAALYREMIVGFNDGRVAWEGARITRGSTAIDVVLADIVGTHAKAA